MIILNNKGFTLIELFVALIIFAVGIVGVTKMQMAAVASNSHSLQLTQALNIAEDQIERMKNMALSSAVFTAGTTQNGTPVVTAEGRTFTPSWTVTAIPSSSAVNVAVTVSWTEKAQTYTTTLTFIKGNNQP